MNTLNKALIGTATAAALAVSAISPAMARERGRDGDGISTGEVIAGALILGGIAAVIASSDNNNDRGYDRDRYDYDRAGYRGDASYYDGGRSGNSRDAVSQCVAVAEQRAGGYNGQANVTDIRSIDRTNRGYKVTGSIAVQDYRDGGRGGWGGRDRYDSGRFNCTVQYGRVTNLRLSGL